MQGAAGIELDARVPTEAQLQRLGGTQQGVLVLQVLVQVEPGQAPRRQQRLRRGGRLRRPLLPFVALQRRRAAAQARAAGGGVGGFVAAEEAPWATRGNTRPVELGPIGPRKICCCCCCCSCCVCTGLRAVAVAAAAAAAAAAPLPGSAAPVAVAPVLVGWYGGGSIVWLE